MQQLGSTSTALLLANAGVYVVGAAFKELDGSMVAGAKCAGPGMYSWMGAGADDATCDSMDPFGTTSNAWCCSGTQHKGWSTNDTIGSGNCLWICN